MKVRPRACGVALLALLCLTGCPSEKKQPDLPPPPDAQFWTWFGFEEAHLAERARGPKRGSVMLEITRQVAAVSPGIIAELGIAEAGKPHTLVLSVNGDTTLFPLVTKLVAQAPPLKHWKVVAFRQRQPIAATLQFGDFTVNADDYQFKELARANGKVDIEVRVKGLTPENEQKVDRAVFLLIDHAIGEYDTETKLHAIDIKPMAVAIDPTLKPLSALAAVVDSLPAAPAPDAG